MKVNGFVLTVTILCVVKKTAAIYCYYCNSANNSACIDLAKLDDETKARMIPVVNCDNNVEFPTQNFFCRKIIQTIFHSHRDSEVRVTRGCGWVRYDKPCYRADNTDHLETVCQCFDDHCNGADSADPAAATFLFLTLAACLYFYR